MTTREELQRDGAAMRARLFGAEPSDAASAIVPGIDDLAAEVTFGAVWSRPGLALPDRMIATLAALCAVQGSTICTAMSGRRSISGSTQPPLSRFWCSAASTPSAPAPAASSNPAATRAGAPAPATACRPAEPAETCRCYNRVWLPPPAR